VEVTLLGTGDTTGTPTVGCDCDTCERARELGVERSRFSVHVRSEATGESLLVDASPDFRHQFLARDVPLPDAALITHVHFDHLDGLGNAYRLFDDLPVYAADEVDPETGESVADTIRSKYDYLDRVTVHDVTPFEPARHCSVTASRSPTRRRVANSLSPATRATTSRPSRGRRSRAPTSCSPTPSCPPTSVLTTRSAGPTTTTRASPGPSVRST